MFHCILRLAPSVDVDHVLQALQTLSLQHRHQELQFLSVPALDFHHSVLYPKPLAEKSSLLIFRGFLGADLNVFEVRPPDLSLSKSVDLQINRCCFPSLFGTHMTFLAK